MLVTVVEEEHLFLPIARPMARSLSQKQINKEKTTHGYFVSFM
jgi:hypothetical protein